MDSDKEVLVRVSFEGGAVSLWGRLGPNGDWEYAIGRNESALADLLFEEDKDLLPVLVKEPDSWSASFDDAMRLLERYPWRQGHPSFVHKDFEKQIWQKVLTKRPPRTILFRWARACHVEVDRGIVTLADWLQSSRSTVILTGAGMSTASGVPDFRSKSGWWNDVDPAIVATEEALADSYSTFHAFYSFRIRSLEGLLPNKGHHIISKWEKLGLVNTVATQNVDGFHQMAGSQCVFELHGTIRSARCSRCGHSAVSDDFLNQSRCLICGGTLRPNVILFGEDLPSVAWEGALNAIENSELVIAIGTSLNVYPANRLPSMTKGKTVLVNLEDTPADDEFDLVLHGRAEEILPTVDEWVNQDRG